MKNFFIVVISLAALLFTCTNSFGQNNKSNIPDKLKQKITVNFEDEKFRDIIKEISSITGVRFNYSTKNIPAELKLTLKEKEKPAIEILDKLVKLTGTKLIYTSDSQVIITKEKQPSISGRIIDAEGDFPLIGVNVILEGLPYGAATDIEGNFEIENLDDGTYTIICKYIGYKTKVIENIIVTSQNPFYINIELDEDIISLSEITITPGSFGFMNTKSVAVQTLTREEIQNMSLGEDVYRAITRIPGISSNDFSSKFNVRGGESDEVLVTLDGMMLVEPFHMKDINGGVFSIVDAALIGEANLLSGAFPAEYGDKMSGVFNIKSLNPVNTKDRISASISMMNARLMGQGSFGKQSGSWIVSARRGYLDFILDKVEKENPPQPTYYDIYGKADYWLDSSNRLSVNFLYAGDSFNMSEDDDDSTDTEYSNTYLWMTYDRIWSNSLTTQNVIYFNRYDQRRHGLGYVDDLSKLEFLANDKRNYNMFGIKHNMQYDVNEKLLFKFGLEFSHSSANYDYNTGFLRDYYDQNGDYHEIWKVRELHLDPDGNKFSTYLSSRFKLSDVLVFEIGGRYDQTSYTEDKLFSPRINLSWTISPRTFLRAGYGHFYQSQDIQGIRVQNNETGFHTAELAKHYMTGIEHTFSNGLYLRLEAYYKKLTNLKNAYRKAGHTIEMFPEIQWDVLNLNVENAEAKGLEFLLKYDQGGLFGVWASYALASAEETIKEAYDIDEQKVFEKLTVPRPYDQKHTLNLDLNFRPGKNWHINFAWQYRSGWPYTARLLGESTDNQGEKYYYTYFAPFQSSKYPDYHRLDLKVSKYFMTNYGKFNIFVELINIYNRKNIRNYVFSYSDGDRPILEKKPERWLPFIPSIGVRWDLDL